MYMRQLLIAPTPRAELCRARRSAREAAGRRCRNGIEAQGLGEERDVRAWDWCATQ